MQWRWWGSNSRPLGLESSTLPVSHCAPPLSFGWQAMTAKKKTKKKQQKTWLLSKDLLKIMSRWAKQVAKGAMIAHLIFLFRFSWNFHQNVELMHQSFASTAPTYGDSGGMAELMSGVITFWMSLQCRVNAGIVISHQAHARDDSERSPLMQCSCSWCQWGDSHVISR